MKKFIYITLLLPFLGLSQQESYYSLYQFNMQVINPAFAGAEAPTMASVLNRNQWATVENAPKTTAFAFSSARENNVGLGLSVVSDKVFIEQQTFAYIDFSYRVRLGRTADLFLGLKAGGNFYNADGTGLNSYGVGIDPAQKILSQFNPNVGAGAYLKSDKYWLSFSIPRLFNAERDKDLVVTAKDRVHSYLGGGVTVGINSTFSLKPSVMLRKVQGLPVSADLTGFLSIQNRVDFGLSYRTNASMSFLAFLNVYNGLDIGYAYETPSEQMLSGISLKTHELVLRIRLGDGVETTNEEDSSESEEN
jgi:type IX secretion system PorP/SprF family membrane protein